MVSETVIDCSFTLGNATAPSLRTGFALVLCGCPFSCSQHEFPCASGVGSEDPNLPDPSILIVEGGMARVGNKASDVFTDRVFQNNVSKFFDSFAGDEQSQVP